MPPELILDSFYFPENFATLPADIKNTETRAIRALLRVVVKEKDRDRVFLFDIWGLFVLISLICTLHFVLLFSFDCLASILLL